MRFRVARLLVASTSLLAACTTTLSYRYDAGAGEGGTAVDAGSDADGNALGEGGADTSNLACPGQFCEDFEKPGLALDPLFDLIPRMAGSARYSVVTLAPSGHGMSISADGDFGGYASPNLPLTRSGAASSIEIKCTVRLTKGRRATLLTIFDGANAIRIHVRDAALLVEGQVLADGIIPATPDPFVLTAVFRGTGSTSLSGSVGTTTFLQQSLPALGTSVRVQFAQERDPDAAMAFPTEAIFDDIVIR